MLAKAERSRVETRMTSMLRAKMRDVHGNRDVRVGDISPTGMLVACDRPPQRGEIVDIDVGGHYVVGEVRWSNSRRCGLRSRDRIDVNAIFSGKPPRIRKQARKVVEADPDISRWSMRNLLLAYGTLGVTAFSSAYLIVIYLIL